MQSFKRSNKQDFQEIKLIEEKKSYINSILNTYSFDFIEPNVYSYKRSTVLELINEDFGNLIKFFLISFGEIKKNQETYCKAIVLLFSDISELQDLYFEYKRNQNPYYYIKMKNLIIPYVEEMKHTIRKTIKLYGDENDKADELFKNINSGELA